MNNLQVKLYGTEADSFTYFFDMYLKSKLSKKKGKELEDDEIDAYCRIAADFTALSQGQIETLLGENELIEVICDD